MDQKAKVSIASSSANTSGHEPALLRYRHLSESQSLLRQRILPDLILHCCRGGAGAKSQSLLRQRILPDTLSVSAGLETNRKSQSLLRQRILPDGLLMPPPAPQKGVSIASSSANTSGRYKLRRRHKSHQLCLNRFFVSEYFRTGWGSKPPKWAAKSQSLLRQRILPDGTAGFIGTDSSNKSQSLLRQRILPDLS